MTFYVFYNINNDNTNRNIAVLDNEFIFRVLMFCNLFSVLNNDLCQSVPLPGSTECKVNQIGLEIRKKSFAVCVTADINVLITPFLIYSI